MTIVKTFRTLAFVLWSHKRQIAVASGAGAGIAVGAACDQVTTSGSNWVFYPDVQLHKDAQLGAEIQYSGLCTNGYQVWWSRTGWFNIYNIPQGSALIASCVGGWPTGGGDWGVAYR